MKELKSKMKESKSSNPWVFRIMIFLALAIVVFNLFYTVSNVFGINLTGSSLSVGGSGSPSSSGQTAKPGEMLPYGVTFDQAGYDKLVGYYNTITLGSLTPEQKQRFITIGTKDRTGCGPCCAIGNGPALDANGNARCGCGHIQALIGLMKLLVKDYGNKYTDDQIFQEIVKWKKLFFPGQVADDGSVIQ